MMLYEDALNAADEIVRRAQFDPRRVPEPVRVVYLVGRLDYEITLGGVVGWLTNCGSYASHTVTALELIGAQTCANIVREMLAVFAPDGPAEGDRERARQIEGFEPRTRSSWRALADRLLEWPDDVDGLLRRYVAAHHAEFEVDTGRT